MLRGFPNSARRRRSSRSRPGVRGCRSVTGLWTGEPLTLPYYRDASLAQWVNDVVRERRIRQGRRLLVRDGSIRYGIAGSARRRGFRRRRFREMEPIRKIAALAAVDGLRARRRAPARVRAPRSPESPARVVFVTRCRGRSLPVARARMRCGASTVAQNGVDTDFFSPSPALACPYGPDEERSYSRAQWTTGRTSTRCAGS